MFRNTSMEEWHLCFLAVLSITLVCASCWIRLFVLHHHRFRVKQQFVKWNRRRRNFPGLFSRFTRTWTQSTGIELPSYGYVPESLSGRLTIFMFVSIKES